jgi:hypothetical protein
MDSGAPSITAGRVAAHRLGFPRVPAPYGDPAADEALAADVAAGASSHGGGLWLVSLAMWENCMRFVGDEPITVGQRQLLLDFLPRLHRCPGGYGPSAARMSKICWPYLASLVSPTPLTRASPASVAGGAAAICRRVASWKIT